MSFNPKSKYTIEHNIINIKDFFDYPDDYVIRPPYQRKAVWRESKKLALMDSLFRHYYVPKLVMREVRLSEDKTVNEIIDGQQRIVTVQGFFANEYPLPESLKDLNKDLPGAYYKDLDTDIKKFVDKDMKYHIDIIKNIDEPSNEDHRITATEIFWRLQQGESLNYMEIAYARLSSLTRNFVVKYADDQSFDYEKYKPVDDNPDKLKFFSLLNVDNQRMQHLRFMARFTMIERGNGYANLGDKEITKFINDARKTDGIGDMSFEDTHEARATLKTLRIFYEIFKDDPMLDSKSGIKELSSAEYFIVSIYSLIRHIHSYYVINEDTKAMVREFVHKFYTRWSKPSGSEEDKGILNFRDNRQQGEREFETREMILREIFFEYLRDKDVKLIAKDTKRTFTELERIIIYRKGKGLCQQCLRDNKSEDEARVSWSNYQADHVVPHSKGGQTVLNNAELLCKMHNQIKGAST